MERLVQRGVLQLAAFTPTDAAHVLGLQGTYDHSAAVKAAEVFARNRDRMGKALAADAHEVAQLTIDTLVRRSAEAVLSAAFMHDGLPPDTVRQPIVQAVLDRRLSVATLALGLDAPLVGLGASAATYYPLVAQLLGAECRVPADADVANAVGAVVGRVRLSVECVISAPQQGQFLVHVAGRPPKLFTDLTLARTFAAGQLSAQLATDMAAAGAPVFQIKEVWDEHTVDLGGLEMFVDGSLMMTASGRPQVANQSV